MDNLINRWKQTVENHNRKLSQMREESLGRSVSKDRSMFISSNALNQSQSTKHIPQTEFKNQKDLDVSIEKSNRHSPIRTNLSFTQKENKPPKVNYEKLQNREDEDFVSQYIDQIIALFPETKLKSKKSQKIIDLILNHYSQRFKQLNQTRKEIKARDQDKRENAHANEAITKKLSELEQKLQESERERHKARQERDDLLRQHQQMARDQDNKSEQHQIMSMLRRTQETLEIANQKLEQMFMDNKKRFKEKEELWDSEMAQLKQDIQLFEVKRK
ncbi:UNKNOWN [Stylonychia lemnae]|uniref:Uncharacterized protein n=1 Tax=Stylonychia lemnae TaxID=5949 RepID=A0A077ZXA3_STYLE|nr:UNKNOWN [Stylonychia lemnae]|eukprot:CDW73867.1 UNKNOWN [Stylonychia lemnae]